MSARGAIRDLHPFYQSAGVTSKIGVSASNCVKPENENPGTPENIKRFRKSYKNEAGVTITHYGKVNDPLPPTSHTYGKKTLASDHVNHVLKQPNNEGINEYIKDLREAKYDRFKREPLGQTITRNYNYPEEINDNKFKYGVPTVGSESAKDVIYRHSGLNEEENAKELYKRTHNLYEAGEQKKRNYAWNVDPQNHRFGKSEKIIVDEARFALHPETANETESFPKTNIIKKNVEDFRDFNSDPLGKPKNLGQVNQYVGSDFVYGAKVKEKDAWDAAKCIYGEPTKKDVQQDSNLGKSNRFGYRNVPKPGDETRVFGVPTIRSDIQKPKLRSVADQYNYGDEVPSVELLFPQKFADMGLTKEDFLLKRSKEEIKSIFNAIGIAYKPGKFEGIYQKAQEIENSDDNVSVYAFYQAVKEMDHL